MLDRLYADDCIIWHNVFGRETTRDENLARYHDSYRGQRRRTYNDRIVNTFDDGFVIQYTLNGVHAHRPPGRAVDLHRRHGAATGRSRASTSTWTRRKFARVGRARREGPR